MKALYGTNTVRVRAAAAPQALNLPFCHFSHFSVSPFSKQRHPHRVNIMQEARRLVLDKGVPRASSMASSTSTQPKPFSLLFVCLGNICRSPAAEGVFRNLVSKKGFDSQFTIDSAGTIDYHEGGYSLGLNWIRPWIEITSISRPADFKEFDLILAMDKLNRADIFEAFNGWKRGITYKTMHIKRLS